MYYDHGEYEKLEAGPDNDTGREVAPQLQTLR